MTAGVRVKQGRMPWCRYTIRIVAYPAREDETVYFREGDRP
jgi:hypothetical protein